MVVHLFHQHHPVVPPVQPLVPPIQLIVPPAQTIPTQPIQPAHVPQLNWSHFKPQFAGKPNGNVEAYLLGMNNWIYTHVFQECVKVQCFCLTLVGNARLWYGIKAYKQRWDWVTKSV